MDSLVYYNRLLLKNYRPDSEEIRQNCLGFLQQLEQIDNARKSRYQEIGECPSDALGWRFTPTGGANSSTDQGPMNFQIMYNSNNAEIVCGNQVAYFDHLSDAPNDHHPWIAAVLRGLIWRDQTVSVQRLAPPFAPTLARFASAANVCSVSAVAVRRTALTWSGRRRHFRRSARRRGQQ